FGKVTRGCRICCLERTFYNLWVRIRAYAHCRRQREYLDILTYPFNLQVNNTLKSDSFISNRSTLNTIKCAYRILIPFYNALQEYLIGNQNRFQEETLLEEHPILIGKIANRLMHYDEAKSHFLMALKTSIDESTKAVVQGLISYVYYRLGDYQGALKHVEQAISIKEHLNEKDFILAISYHNLGNIWGELGKFEEAIKCLTQSKRVQDGFVSSQHLDLSARHLNCLGVFLYETGNYQESESHLKKALKLRKKLNGENHLVTSQIYNQIGVLFSRQKKHEEAREHFSNWLKQSKRLLGKLHPITAGAYENLGTTLVYLKEFDQALRYLKKGLYLKQKIFGDKHPNLAINYANIAFYFAEIRKHEIAIKYYKKALKILKDPKQKHLNSARFYQNIGISYSKLGLFKLAKYNLKLAFSIYEKQIKTNQTNHSFEKLDCIKELYILIISKNYLNACRGIYSEQLIDNKPHGLNVTPDGRIYIGQWNNGKPEGFGWLICLDNFQYLGYWKDGLRHGTGKFILPSKVEIEGEFECGIFKPANVLFQS
ncbi:MAG: tetratricopeptide repeat protein, partial [Silvanigrellaceae bacterium]|nr:tetratricopeptide repeat protein [Silvanigrellaceae bacterium]